MLTDTLIIFSIVVTECLLSVDNALVNAAIAKKLDEKKQKKAIRLGISLGLVFRVIAIFFIGFIIKYTTVRLVGALYLVYIMIKELCADGNIEKKEKVNSGKEKEEILWQVILSIAVADIIFSFDNVIAALGISHNLVLVIIGIAAGMVVMAYATQIVLVLMRRYTRLAKAAYVVVGVIGGILFFQTLLNIEVSSDIKFLFILTVLAITIIYEEWRKIFPKKAAEKKK